MTFGYRALPSTLRTGSGPAAWDGTRAGAEVSSAAGLLAGGQDRL